MGRNTMRNSINNAMRRKLFSEFLKDKENKKINKLNRQVK